jgi:transposase
MSEPIDPSTSFRLEPGVPGPAPRTLRRGIRFHGEEVNQLDPIQGCPELMVPEDHPARTIIRWVERLDLTPFRARLKPLGRTPIDPKFRLRVWLYGSLIGIHHASKLAELAETDAALRLLAGGHGVSPSRLKEFRSDNGPALSDALRQLLRYGIEAGLVDPRALAVDSMRLRARASGDSISTKSRSSRRLKELKVADGGDLAPEVQAEHQAKVEAHQAVIDTCAQRGVTSYSSSNPMASLMKFPSGASAPGHRITAVASGKRDRFIVWAAVDSAPSDYGKLTEAVLGARGALFDAGLPMDDLFMQVAADAGYMSQSDLEFAHEQRLRGEVDVVLPGAKEPTLRGADGRLLFSRDDFYVDDEGAICPRLVPMEGPTTDREGRRTWRGAACADCPLKSLCTDGEVRTFSINPVTDSLRRATRERIADAAIKARYNERIATIEPVFAYLEDVLQYRRASSAKAESIRGEVYLKVMTYNITRLQAAARRHARVNVQLAWCDTSGPAPRLEPIDG